MNKKEKILGVCTAAILLSACVGPSTRWTSSPYKLPDGIERANLTNAIPTPSGKEDKIWIETPLDDCETIRTSHDLKVGELFKMRGDGPEVKDTIQVPANRPFYIQYKATTGDAYCFVHVVVNLKEGKSYTLIGGYKTITGMIPILSTSGGCALGVMDNETRKLVPNEGSICRKK